MGKICDPPPFTGGQMAAVEYLIQIRRSSAAGTDYWIHQANSRGTPSAAPRTDAQMRGAYPFIYNRLGRILGVGALNFVSTTQMWWDLNTSSGVISNFFGLPYALGTTISIFRVIPRSASVIDTGGDLPSTNCRCTSDSCRVDCIGQPDGFCCIDHSVTNRLLQTLQN